MSTTIFQLPHRVIGLLGNNPILERLACASVEMMLLAAMIAVGIRLLRLRSARVRYLLWLIVLIKPFISLSLGSLVQLTVSVPDAAPILTPVSPTTAAMSISPARVLLLLWLIGIAACTARYVLARIRLRGIVRGCTCPNNVAMSRYTAIAQEWHVNRPPRLLVTDALESPALVGLLRPTILVPRWLTEAQHTERLEWSLRHELTHARQFDVLGVLLRDLAVIIFWFNPAAWWTGRKLTEEMELACDQRMLSSADQAADYAEQLFRILHGIRHQRRLGVAGGLFATRTLIGRRIEVLLDGRVRPGRVSLTALVGVVAIAFASLCIGAAVRPGQPAQAVPPPTLAVPEVADDAPSPADTDEAKVGPVQPVAQPVMGFGGYSQVTPAPSRAGEPAHRAAETAQPGGFGGYGGYSAPARPMGMGGGYLGSSRPQSTH